MVTRGVLETLSLPAALRHGAEGVSNLGVVVTASEEVVLYALNTDYQSADAFTVYPVDVLSTEYYAAGSKDYACLIVCATEDSTTVR